MSKPADRRVLGLSPRARRVVVPFLVIAAVLVVIAYFSSKSSDEPIGAGPVVGRALHAADDPEQRIFVGGHGGPGHRADRGSLTQLDSLDNENVIGWVSSEARVQAAGQPGGLRR